jgi:hypothetical protein
MRTPISNPESLEFWLQYTEPHEEFVRGAARLRDTVADGTDSSSPTDGDDLGFVFDCVALESGRD